MNHRWRMRTRLQRYRDGDLRRREQTAFERHLEECPVCTSALHRLEETERFLFEIRPEPPMLSPEASRAILDRALAIASVSAQQPTRVCLRTSSAVAAALLVAYASGPVLHSRVPGDRVSVNPSEEPPRVGAAEPLPGRRIPEALLAEVNAQVLQTVLRLTGHPDNTGNTLTTETAFRPYHHRRNLQLPPGIVVAARPPYPSVPGRVYFMKASPEAGEDGPLQSSPGPEDQPAGQQSLRGARALKVIVTKAEEATPGLVQTLTFQADEDGSRSWKKCSIVTDANGKETSRQYTEWMVKPGAQTASLIVEVTTDRVKATPDGAEAMPDSVEATPDSTEATDSAETSPDSDEATMEDVETTPDRDAAPIGSGETTPERVDTKTESPETPGGANS
jgi:hypothetical protein